MDHFYLRSFWKFSDLNQRPTMPKRHVVPSLERLSMLNIVHNIHGWTKNYEDNYMGKGVYRFIIGPFDVIGEYLFKFKRFVLVYKLECLYSHWQCHIGDCIFFCEILHKHTKCRWNSWITQPLQKHQNYDHHFIVMSSSFSPLIYIFFPNYDFI